MLKFVQRHPLATIVVISLSIVVNIFGIWYFVNHETAIEHDLEETSQNLPFLSKRIFAENPNDILINFVDLRQQLRDYVAKEANNKMSIYFEYLPSGTNIGVDEKAEIRLASLSKVPVVMAALREIEAGKLTEDTVMTIKKEDINPTFGSVWQKGEGGKITVKEAIEKSLTESDNTAQNTLLSNLSHERVVEVYNALDIRLNVQDEAPFVTAKTFSSVFRSLYLASYLNRENSNKVLDTLSRSIYNDKIVAGVPNDVKVAHKISVFETENPVDTYSDCGIVYAPLRPYILCMFTAGSNDEAKKYMSTISKKVYDFVSQANKSN